MNRTSKSSAPSNRWAVLGRRIPLAVVPLLLIAGGVLTLSPGCSVGKKDWEGPPLTSTTISPGSQVVFKKVGVNDASEDLPKAVAQLRQHYRDQPRRQVSLALAEGCYAAASQAEEKRRAQASAYYYEAAAFAYEYLYPTLVPPARVLEAIPSERERALTLYNSALAKCLETAIERKRFKPDSELVIERDQGTLTVQVAHRGFAWQPSDFDRAVLIGEYETTAVTTKHRRPGLGAPMVVVHEQQGATTKSEQFLPKEVPFAATAILRPNIDALLPPSKDPAAAITVGTNTQPSVLEIHDPLRVHKVAVAGEQAPLAADLTAPLALISNKTKSTAIALVGFIKPDLAAEAAGLYLFEPYQPGKIPVVLVHGLASDPNTWSELGNELRTRPELDAKYQFWYFRYPTGNPFVLSAATFRQQLRDAVETFDPNGQDPALREMVLIGHSMGGLLSKLQVMSSQNTLWDLISTKPIEQIKADDSVKQQMQAAFFFEPQPFVKQVIFMGTPHRGSVWGENIVGQWSSKLVKLPGQLVATHERLVKDNPDTFTPLFSNMIPTSINLLAPNNAVLEAVASLDVNPEVQLHSVIGVSYPLPDGTDGDGVVPLESAQIIPVASEIMVSATHTMVHRHRDAIENVRQILLQHSGRTASGSPSATTIR